MPRITQAEVRVQILGKDGRYAEGRAINPKKEFRTLGEQMIAVAQSTMGIKQDGRLVRAISGMGESVGADGAFLLQQDFATDLATRAYNTGEILSRVQKRPIGPGSNGLTLSMLNETSRANGSRWGGLRVYRTAEGGTPTSTKAGFRQIKMELKKLFGLCYATDELLQDAVALEATLYDIVPKEMGFVMEDEIINGTGVGMMFGILTAGALVSVAKETGQDAATIVKENLDKMWSRMYAASRANAVWLINQDIEPQLDNLQLAIGTGGVPVYLPPGGLSETPFARLKGRPVIPVEYCPTLGTKRS